MSEIDYENNSLEIDAASTHQAVLRFSDSLQRAQEVFEDHGYTDVRPLISMIADSSKVGWTAARLVDRALSEEASVEEIEEAEDYAYNLDSASDFLEDLCDRIEEGGELTKEDMCDMSQIKDDLFSIEEDDE